MFDLVVFTEGTFSLEESYNMDSEDRQIAMDSFEEYVKAKYPGNKNNMKQEQL